MRPAASSWDAAPQDRSVHRETRGPAPRQSARSPSPTVLADRAGHQEACRKVAGTDSAVCDAVPRTAATRSPCATLSSTAFVNSSTNSGTPSVRSTISATISAVIPALPISLHQRLSVASAEPIEHQTHDVERPAQGGRNSGRKVITSNTGSRCTWSTIRSRSSREVGSIQWASSNTMSTVRCRASASSWLRNISNSFSRLSCGLRLRSAAELGSDNNSLNSAMSSSPREPGVTSALPLERQAGGPGIPAARSS